MAEKHSTVRALFWVGLMLFTSTCLAHSQEQLQSQSPLREPLPLQVASQLNTHNGRSPLDLSPDGDWVAHTYSGAETVPRDTPFYSASGFPLAEGNARMHAVVTHARSGQVLPLGAADASSWGAAWSPDGKRVAFYSDAGGEAGLWVWEHATRSARRVPGVVVRPFFGFETVRWMADSRRLAVKLLPAGVSLAQANGATSQPDGDRGFRKVGAGEASVVVLSSAPAQRGSGPGGPPPGPPPANPTTAQLAVVDVDSGAVTRVGEPGQVRYYAFSPDQRSLAYVVMSGFEPDSQQPTYDFMVHDLAGGRSQRLAGDVRMAYGTEWSWSPDGRHIAYIQSGLGADGTIAVIAVVGGRVWRPGMGKAPSLDPGDGILPPLWSAKGDALYAVGRDGKLWHVPWPSGSARIAAAIDGFHIAEIVAERQGAAVWTARDGKLRVMARSSETRRSGIFAVDPAQGIAEPELLEDGRRYSTYFNLDVSDASGEIAYVSTSQQRPFDVWLFDPAQRTTRQATRLNPDLERYQLGEARIVEWAGADGQTQRGALLLPPGYRDGERLPTVTWVYAGDKGADQVDSFGLRGNVETFNMHVLATRGYAVFYPNIPVNPGTPTRDVIDTMMPAMDALVAQGYADPQRLAVMGQSYGSYNVLSLLGHTDRFKAAILTGAVVHPDLVAGYLEMRPDGFASNTGYYEQGQGNMGGTPWEHPERYRENSPIYQFDRIRTPVLIGQGEKDGRLFASDAIFVGLRRLGKDVEYRIYQDESHVIKHRANVIDFWQRRIDFLEQHLGGIRRSDAADPGAARSH